MFLVVINISPIDFRIIKLINTISNIHQTLLKKNLLNQINNSNGYKYLLSIEDVQAYPFIMGMDETLEFNNNINLRFQNLIKMLQLILIKRYLKIDDKSNKQINYQECFILIFLLLCGCLNRNSGIDFDQGNRSLNVSINVFCNRFFNLLYEKNVEKDLHKIPSEGVYEGIFNQFSKSLSLKVSRLIIHKNKKFYINLFNDKNKIRKEKLEIILRKIKEYCKDKTREIINGSFEIYFDLQTELEKYSGKNNSQIQKLILK